MKKIFLTLAILATANLYALSWSQIKSWGDKTVKPDAQYSVETEGFNVRIYEFTPLTDPGSLCIMSFTNERMGVYCFAKSDKALKKK